MAACQLPLLWFLYVQAGAPALSLVAFLIVFNAQIGIRLWYLPKPYPPPVWFERYVIWGWFFLSLTSSFFAGAIILIVSVGVPLTWGWVALLVSALVAGWAVGIPFRIVSVRRVEIPIDGLPEALDGLSIAQMTDLHAGPMVSERQMARWVGKVNALRPDFVVLTGDLIASGAQFVPALERSLARLSPSRGTLAIMGNHDYFGGAVDAVVAMHER
ncbi:MAG: hypothetical protein ACI9OJ_000289, partial [Myxococcota bacterium]